jgi:hypothetical protein
MMMECPKDKTHDRFVVTAHVTEDWVVDANGDYIETFLRSDCVVIHEPDEEDVWQCFMCDTVAVKVEEVNDENADD